MYVLHSYKVTGLRFARGCEAGLAPEPGTFHSIRCRMHWPGSTLLLKMNPDAIVELAAEIRSH